MARIDKKYDFLLGHILHEGFRYEDPNRKGVYRLQIPTYTIKHDLTHSFPAITTKELYWKGVVGELLWFLKGETNIKYLVDNGINIWNKDAYNYYLKECKKSAKPGLNFEEFVLAVKSNVPSTRINYRFGDLGRIYGAQWRNWSAEKPKDYNSINLKTYYVDQISNLIKGLKEKPMGTQHIVTAWNPAELDEMALPPCHWSFEILVEPLSPIDIVENAKRLGLWFDKYEDLDWARKQQAKFPKYQFTLKWHQRSVDTFLGLPFNIASYALLAHIIGALTNMIPKGIIGDLSNVHIYEDHLDAVKKQLNRDCNKHGECHLDTISGFKPGMNNHFDTWLNSKSISDFKLIGYKSYPPIKAEMLSRD